MFPEHVLSAKNCKCFKETYDMGSPITYKELEKQQIYVLQKYITTPKTN